MWRESLVPASSGRAGAPITFAPYGQGDAPILTSPRVESKGIFVADGEDATTHNFTSATQLGSSTFKIINTSPLHGAYSYLATSDGVHFAYASKEVAGQRDLHVRFYLQIPSTFSERADYNYSYILRLLSQGTVKTQLYLQQYTKLMFQIHGQLMFGSYANYGTANLARGTTHCVEIHYVASAAVGGFQIWVDGTSLGSIFNQNSSGNIDTVQLGIISQNAPTIDANIEFDDLKVSTTGPIGSWANATPNALDINGKSYIRRVSGARQFLTPAMWQFCSTAHPTTTSLTTLPSMTSTTTLAIRAAF